MHGILGALMVLAILISPLLIVWAIELAGCVPSVLGIISATFQMGFLFLRHPREARRVWAEIGMVGAKEPTA